MSDSVRPHRRQPTRLRHPWDPPGKDTGVGCHFLLQCRKVKSESDIAQSCPTPRDPMDYSPPGSSIHGIFQARVLEWGAIAFSNVTSIIPDTKDLYLLTFLSLLVISKKLFHCFYLLYASVYSKYKNHLKHVNIFHHLKQRTTKMSTNS